MTEISRQPLRPRKSLGQHFLVNPALARRIVEAAQISPNDLVIEIGSGTGALTRPLLERAAHVVAIEIDPNMIARLRQSFGAAVNLTLIQQDFLTIDLAQVASALHAQGIAFAAVRAVANLPYYITSAAIRSLLESPLPFVTIVLTVQLEVAERITAQPPDMSLLGVSVQFYGTPELLFRIPASQFHPRPAVDSAVVRIRPHPSQPQVDREVFFRWVRAGFSQPRKQLRNTLAAGLQMPKADVEAALMRVGIDPSRRAESLSLAEWIRLARSVTNSV
ncbi:MAG: 16S rRNA (adenine(1518)-N(6)/adenine(1519)-N(6))-dimethyltransferase RsmA [Anaerolineae bacterium]|nr:16S rRNA (adenine(1518)-N(6)/adenine(1519)-N(6))-dimethyltransferase RsmA [Anaerolineae bacterium]